MQRCAHPLYQSSNLVDSQKYFSSELHTHIISFYKSFMKQHITLIYGTYYNKSTFYTPVRSCGNGTPLQYSCLENPMDGGAWQAAVHGVAKSRTRLSNFTFTFHFHALEKDMATHSSILAWIIPGMGEPGGLPSMGLHGVGHN